MCLKCTVVVFYFSQQRVRVQEPHGRGIVTVLGLVGGAPGGETPRVAAPPPPNGIPRRALSSPDGEDSQTTAIFISKRLLGNRKKLLGAPERALFL